MSKLQGSDAKQLWNEMGQNKSWDSLHKALASHRNKAGGIDDSTVDMLMMKTKQLKSNGTPFPNSEQKMEEELNKGLS